MTDSEKTNEANPNTGGGSSSKKLGDDNLTKSLFPITTRRFNGKNYLEWSQTLKLAIRGRGKLSHLTGKPPPPPNSSDPNHEQWMEDDSLIMSWQINSMEDNVGKPYIFLPSSNAIWEAVKETFSDLENPAQIYELKSKLWFTKQGNKSVTEYFSDMAAIWQELDQCYDDGWECSGDSTRAQKREESDRIFQFLTGLRKEFDEVKARILSQKPVPSLREACAVLRREEGRRKCMMQPEEGAARTDGDSESSAMISKK